MASPSCSLCSVGLPRTISRRVLRSPAAAPVFTIVCQMTSELFPGSRGDSIIYEDAYLCKQCFRAVERYVKTKESLQQQHKQLKDKILSAGETRGLLQVCSERRAVHGEGKGTINKC